MAAILDCPCEIIQAILDLLSLSHFHALSLTNKSLRTFVEPYLYSTIEWEWRPRSPPLPITLLIRTLLRRPDLSNHVKRLTIHGLQLSSMKGATPQIPTRGLEMNKVAEFIQHTEVPFGAVWIDDARTGTVDALVTILVSQLSNIEYLDLGPDVTENNNHFAKMLRAAVCPPENHRLPSFRQLRKVAYTSYEGRYDTNVVDPAGALSLFYLPAVEHIEAFIRNPVRFTWPAVYMPDPSNITSLHIKKLREPNLGHILSITKSLKKLHWEWYHEPNRTWSEWVNTPVANLDHVVDALSHVRDTLTDLSIEGFCGSNDLDDLPTLTITGSLRGLVSFDKITRFRAPLAFLVGFKPDASNPLELVIPPGVEEVCITDDFSFNDNYEWVEEDTSHLIEQWLEPEKASAPSLSRISLQVPETYGPALAEMRVRLRHVCTRLGVEVIVMAR